MNGGVRIRGLKEEINLIGSKIGAKRSEVKRMCVKISEDLLRKSRDNAPVREGTLIDSMTGGIRDLGVGDGLLIIVSAGNATSPQGYPYPERMHEGYYQAHDPHDKGKDKTTQTIRFRRGGLKVTQKVAKRRAGGFWIDSKGNKHGRKYLTRALKDNYPRYFTALTALGDRR